MTNTHSIDLELSSSQYLSRADASLVGLEIAGDLTLECWIKVESIATDGSLIIAAKDNTANNRSYQWAYQDVSGVKRFLFSVSDDGSTMTNATLNTTRIVTGIWHHVAVVYDASAGSATFYVDGVAAGAAQTGLDTSIYNGTAPFTIGAKMSSGSPTQFFDGLINDFRVWNDERTVTELRENAGKELVGNEAGLVAYWKFNNSLLDETSNGNDLTNNGSAVFSTDIPWEEAEGVDGSTNLETGLISYYPLDEESGTREDVKGSNDLTDNNTVLFDTGKQGNAADFEKDNAEYLEITDGSQTGLDLSSSFSFSHWVKFESIVAGDIFISKGAASGQRSYEYKIVSTTQIALQIWDTSDLNTQLTATVPTISTGTWYHFVSSYNLTTGEWKIYVNGVLADIETGGRTSIKNATAPFRVGAWGQGGNYIDGLMDELAIYTRTLHWGDVLDLYAEGNPIPYIGTISQLVSETVTMQDTAQKSLTRLLNEVATLVDTADTTLILTKQLAEELSLSDSLIEAITGKTLFETITLAETLARTISKTITDTATLVATATSGIFYTRTFSDNTTLSDAIGIIKDFGVILTERITAVVRFAGKINGLNIIYAKKYATKVVGYIKKYLAIK